MRNLGSDRDMVFLNFGGLTWLGCSRERAAWEIEQARAAGIEPEVYDPNESLSEEREAA